VEARRDDAIEFAEGRNDAAFIGCDLEKAAEEPEARDDAGAGHGGLSVESRSAPAVAWEHYFPDALARGLQEFVEIGRLIAGRAAAIIIAAGSWPVIAASGLARRLAPGTANGPPTGTAAFSGIILPGHFLSFPPARRLRPIFWIGAPQPEKAGLAKELRRIYVNDFRRRNVIA
jgi:hypothetical protein